VAGLRGLEIDAISRVPCASSSRRRAPRTMQWNGARWSIITDPNLTVGLETLNAVSCIAPMNCVAVGDSVIERS